MEKYIVLTVRRLDNDKASINSPQNWSIGSMFCSFCSQVSQAIPKCGPICLSTKIKIWKSF